MLGVDDIVRIALREHDGTTPDQDTYLATVKRALEHPSEIPAYSRTSKPLSLVRFRCLLQDTGYPSEVYLPADAEVEGDDKVDWSKLKERWVGWAVEIPGEQAWARRGDAGSVGVGAESGNLAQELSALSVDDALPPVIEGKYPLPDVAYTGALLKVYDDVSYRPASAYDVVGIVSSAPVPTPYEGDESEAPLVPALHVVLPPAPGFPAPPLPGDGTRDALVSYLASTFSPPDAVAGELLLLALLSHPSTRPSALPPLGTLSLNLIRPAVSSPRLTSVLGSLMPAVVPLPLSLDLLHKTRFRPASKDGTSLTPGVLQLAPGTLLLIDEDGLGNGGALSATALQNVQALGEAVQDQIVKYEYPFMDGLRIECALRAVVTSEGRSLLTADVCVPVTLAEEATGQGEASTAATTDSAADLAGFRAYLQHHGAPLHAEKVTIPDAVGEAVQDDFVAQRRRDGAGSVEAAEARLKRRMKIARLLALSYPDATLTEERWRRTVELDDEVERRLAQREAARRETKLGAPTANGSESKEGAGDADKA